MDIFPSKYQQLELNRHEKVFVRYACNTGSAFGFVLLHVNPAMIKDEKLNIIISSRGIVVCKFFDLAIPDIFPKFIEALRRGIYSLTSDAVVKKLESNLALLGSDSKLRFPVSQIYIFPNLSAKSIGLSIIPTELKVFIENNCVFSEVFSEMRTNFLSITNKFLKNSLTGLSKEIIEISDRNISSILQRIAPEYTVIRPISLEIEKTTPGVDEELLVITDDDSAVRAFCLNPEQINIVNKIIKGDQLILACAGSGKSVLLIAKCFKAARMNPDKKFLITCFNRNLRSLYTWFIERAGLQERNVDCMTFDALCRELLRENNLQVPRDFEMCHQATFNAFNQLKIHKRYYGIFIDEVQMFEQDWYKLCYNLLENKESNDHLFVICGDKTQEIKKRQRHGRAPWNVGDGYPNYRGGNKNIRIEKNFRNCIQINDYINRFANDARTLVHQLLPDDPFDPDLFLRGQAFRAGIGVKIKNVTGNARDEAEEVIRSINELHDEQRIPYDEIAVLMFNRRFAPRKYYIESAVNSCLIQADIPYSKLYSDEVSWGSAYGSGGISLITIDSVLGLDFRAVIMCGIMPLGQYDKTKRLKLNDSTSEEDGEALKQNISRLYVACTRAKDALHIVLLEKPDQSIYVKLLTGLSGD